MKIQKLNLLALAVTCIMFQGACLESISQKNTNTQTPSVQWSGDFRLFGKLTAQVDGPLTVITADNPEKAKQTGSKLIADMMGFGDVKRVDGKTFEIPELGYRCIGLDRNKVKVLFAKTYPELQKLGKEYGFDQWKMIPDHCYPNWLDRYDNHAFYMGVMGWGSLPKDYRTGMEWIGKLGINFIAEHNNPNIQFAPGVWDLTVTKFYAAEAKKYGLAYQTYIPWAHQDYPNFMFDQVPLPWYQAPKNTVPYEDVRHNRLANNSLLPASEKSIGMVGTMYRELAKRQGEDPDFATHFGIVEIGGNHTVTSLAYANSPDKIKAWRENLKEVTKEDLAEAGRLMRNDPKAYKSWDEVEFPTVQNLIDRDNNKLDLRGQWEMCSSNDANAVQPPAGAHWQKISCNNPMSVLLYKKKGTGSFWLRRNFDSNGTQKFLHVSRVAWHGRKSNVPDKVWLNGKELKNITREHPLTGDVDGCYEVGKNLIKGTNTIVLKTLSPLIPHYILLNNTGRFHYLSKDEKLNKFFYEFSEFAARQQVDGITKILSSIQTGDPDHRPIQLMCPNAVFDLLLPKLKKYATHAHCTGQNQGCWAPWTTRYSATHGLPFSSEVGGAPADGAGFRSALTRYMMLGLDTVNLLFDPTMYMSNGKKEFLENNVEIIKTFGKLKLPKGDVGILRSVRNASRLNADQPWTYDVSRGAIQSCGRTFDLLTLADFRNGDVPYDVVIDAATSIMTEDDVNAILKYVENGGTFITMQGTGTHSETKAYAMPLEKLSGMKIVNRGRGGMMTFTKTQNIWPRLRGKTIRSWGQVYDWKNVPASDQALQMKKVDPNITVIAEWDGIAPEQGNIAVAERRCGKGKFLIMGASYAYNSRDQGGSYEVDAGSYPFLAELLDNLKVHRTSGNHQTPGMRNVFAETRRSKNGLYDVYLLARGNDRKGLPPASPKWYISGKPVSLHEFSLTGHPAVPFEFKDGALCLKDIPLEAMQTRIYASPHADQRESVLFWLKALHQNWYQLDTPEFQPSPEKKDPWVMGLNDGWFVSEVSAEAIKLKGKVVELGAFNTLDIPDESVVSFKKTVHLPKDWKGKRIEFGFESQYWFWGVFPAGKLLMNGKEIRVFKPQPNCAFAMDIPYTETFELELTINGKLMKNAKRSRPSGVTGLFFVKAYDQPKKLIPLTNWKAVQGWDKFVPVKTGEKAAYQYLQTEFPTPTGDWKSIRLESSCAIGWVCINGSWQALSGHTRHFEVSGLLNRDGKMNVLRWWPGQVLERPTLPEKPKVKDFSATMNLTCF